jgi:hypothetical protein
MVHCGLTFSPIKLDMSDSFFSVVCGVVRWWCRALRGDQNKVYSYSWGFYIGKAFIGLGVCSCALSVVLLIQTSVKPVNTNTNDSSATASVGLQVSADSPPAVIWLVVFGLMFLITW